MEKRGLLHAHLVGDLLQRRRVEALAREAAGRDGQNMRADVHGDYRAVCTGLPNGSPLVPAMSDAARLSTQKLLSSRGPGHAAPEMATEKAGRCRLHVLYRMAVSRQPCGRVPLCPARPSRRRARACRFRNRHILEAGRGTLGRLGRVALVTIEQQLLGKKSPRARPRFPGRRSRPRYPPRSHELVRDYVKHVGGDPSAYKNTLPPHMFPQWGFGLGGRALDGRAVPHLQGAQRRLQPRDPRADPRQRAAARDRALSRASTTTAAAPCCSSA